ncbi:uncharacterized protein LOC113646310 isoform X2 [Tachysurus fulvidraco]|uniref:uncharacterized protein LOC113646310 isoform X2 n=1 Tax=Tachysurus fulvidraco TaxID=1234273 RepID=UPI001FF04CAE|nr:uncharacterized protein LOC113646310 isoform X2 [Tachysurus fulvidraco]
MMKCLYLLYVVFHVSAGCDLSVQTKYVYIGHPGGSVLLPCSCSDLHTKPHTFTWMAYIRGGLKDMLNDEHYRGRLQLFNHISPGNLSLLISDLRLEDDVDYRCKTEKEHRDMRIYVKGCYLSAQTKYEYNGHPGGSVLLPCSCSDLHTKPHTFTWMAYIRGGLNDMLNDEHYRGRLQLFNHISPGNLSLLISDLRLEDDVDYRCRTEKDHRDMRIYVKGCDLSGDKHQVVINGHPGGSVLLPCSCSDLHTKPHTFTWTTDRTGHWTDVFKDELYRDRLQLFNHISPGNLSLLIFDLREEDQRVYRCRTGLREYRNIRINVKGCDLSGDKHQVVINGHPGGSVLLPCSCSDLHTKPHTFTWTTNRTGHWTDVLNDEHYRDRLQLFNHISPGNLSLLISDLREEDQRDYRCSTGLKEYRYMRINVQRKTFKYSIKVYI